MAVDSLSAPPARGPEAGAPPSAYADWSHRLVAMLLDLGIVSFATWLIAGQAPILAPAPVWGANPVEHTWPEAWTPAWWGLAALYSAYVCLQAWTGATPGKAALGIRVLGDTSGRPIGILWTILRWLAHLIDAILFIGYLRPLWHPRRQTFADSLLHTVVVRNTPRRVGLWRVAALIVGLVAGGLSLVSASGSSSTAEAGASCTAADDTHVTASVERVDRWSERGFIRRDEPATWSIALDIRGLAARTHSIELAAGGRVWHVPLSGDAGAATADDLSYEYDVTDAAGPWVTVRLEGLDVATRTAALRVTGIGPAGAPAVLCTLPGRG